MSKISRNQYRDDYFYHQTRSS